MIGVQGNIILLAHYNKKKKKENNKDLSKFEDKLDITYICFFKSVENMVGKGENAGLQHFLLFPQCFQKYFFTKRVTSHLYVVKG